MAPRRRRSAEAFALHRNENAIMLLKSIDRSFPFVVAVAQPPSVGRIVEMRGHPVGAYIVLDESNDGAAAAIVFDEAARRPTDIDRRPTVRPARSKRAQTVEGNRHARNTDGPVQDGKLHAVPFDIGALVALTGAAGAAAILKVTHYDIRRDARLREQFEEVLREIAELPAGVVDADGHVPGDAVFGWNEVARTVTGREALDDGQRDARGEWCRPTVGRAPRDRSTGSRDRRARRRGPLVGQ